MRHILPIILTSALLSAPASAADKPLAVPLSDKAQKALEKYEPIGTRSCIPLAQMRGSRIIDETAIIYEFSSKKVYVNQPADGTCRALKPDRAVAVQLPSTNLCNLDIVNVIDPASRIALGGCPLGEFTEYRKKQ